MGTDGAGTAPLGPKTSRPALVSALVFALGCASAAPPAENARAPKASGLAAYLPLADATVFSYATTTEPAGEQGLLVLEIRRPRAEVVELVVAGRVRRMNVTAQGIAHVTGGFLLRAPLAVGENWQGDFGHVRVTSIDRKVVVPAGRFEGCVETVEEMTTNAGTKRTTTAYCPGIGIALRETEAEQEGERAVERIALKSYGKRF